MNIFFTEVVKDIWTGHVGIGCIFAGFKGKGLCAMFIIALLSFVNNKKLNNTSKELMKAFVFILFLFVFWVFFLINRFIEWLIMCMCLQLIILFIGADMS